MTYSPNVRAALAALAPPPKLQLSTWMEEHIRLPAGDAAVPGKIRLYGYQRGIADAIGDPLLERVTVIKSARIGYTTILVGALANYVHNDPSSLLCLLPVKDDARNFVVSQVEPVFAESPVVRAKLDAPKSHAHDRDTMLFRRFTGRLLKCWPELQIVFMQLAREGSPPPGLRLPQAIVTEFQSDSSRTDSPVRVLHAQPGSAVSVGRVRRGEICPTFRRVGLRYDQVTVIAESGGWYFAQDLTNTLRFVIAAVPRARRLDTMRFKARSAGAGENGRAMVAGLGHWLRSSVAVSHCKDLFG